MEMKFNHEWTRIKDPIEGVLKFVCGSQPEIGDGSDQEEGASRAGPGRQEAKIDSHTEKLTLASDFVNVRSQFAPFPVVSGSCI
jgi:hypothetical protein